MPANILGHPGWKLSRNCIRDTLLIKHDGALPRSGMIRSLYNWNIRSLRDTQLAPHIEGTMRRSRFLDMHTIKKTNLPSQRRDRMGWDYGHEDVCNQSRKDLVIKHLNFNNPPHSCKVLYASQRGSTVYAAVGCRNEETRLNKVVGVVVLTHIASREYFNFSTKILEETMGPYQCDAPKKLIDMLSPTDCEYARRWRDECLGNVLRRRSSTPLLALDYGSVIELTDGSKQRLEVYRHRGQKVFKLIGRWARIPAGRIARAGYRIVSEVKCSGKEESL